MNAGQLELPGSATSATMTTMMQHCVSPGGVIPHSMALGPPSSIGHTPNTSCGTASKGKSSHSSTHTNGGGAGAGGNGRKRHSPIPGSNAGDGAAAKPHQFMLVAAEAIQLKDAGKHNRAWGSRAGVQD